MDTTLLHLDKMIAQGYRTKRTMVWGTPVRTAIEQDKAEYQPLQDAYLNARFGFVEVAQFRIGEAIGCERDQHRDEVY